MGSTIYAISSKILRKYGGNPILSPNEENAWENLVVCNPGAWYEDGKVYLLYRASGDDEQHVIHFGLAVSADGFHFERVSDAPVLSPSADGPDAGCIEDPRIVKFGEHFYITYAYRTFPPGRYWLNENSQAYMPNGPADAPRFIRENLTNSGLLISEDLRTFHRVGRITAANSDNRDVILFPEKIDGRYAMLHRPKERVGSRYLCEYPSIWITFSEDLMVWSEDYLLIKGESSWETKVGGAAPPVKTEEGWLTLYHGVDMNGIYRTGVVLLDYYDPRKVIARSPDFIMEPDQAYETNGLYPGCVFPTGNVIIEDELFVYYGAGDKFCCLAVCSVQELLDYVLRYRSRRLW